MSANNEQERFLGRTSRFGLKYYFVILLAVAFTLPFVTRGARRAIETNNNDVRDWLPDAAAESTDLRWFQKHFLGEQFIIASWEGCTLGDNEKLKLLAEKLVPSRLQEDDEQEQAVVNERHKLFKKIITGPQVLEQLQAEPLSLGYHEAIRRMEGMLVGPLPDKEGANDEDRITCLVVTLSETGKVDNKAKRKAIEELYRVAEQECNLPSSGPGRMHLGGPPVDNVAIDVEGERTLQRLALLAGIVGVSLAYLCFRSIRLTIFVFMVGAVSAGMSLAVVYFFGGYEKLVLGMPRPRLGSVDAILLTMPSVVYVLGLSGAIHIVNYYRDAVREHGVEGAAEDAVRHGWNPCCLAALTTAIGFASLYTSHIIPIKKFGLFSAVSVLLTLTLLFTYLPACLHRFPGDDQERAAKQKSAKPKYVWLSNFMHLIASAVIRRSGVITVVGIVLIAFLGFGLTKIKTSVQLMKLFDEDAQIIHDYLWLEQHLGDLVPMEVVLRVSPESRRGVDELPEQDGLRYRMNMLERIQLAQRVEEQIEKLAEVRVAISAATFSRDLPEEDGTFGLNIRLVVNERLEEHREEILAGDYLREELEGVQRSSALDPQDRQGELWRVSARLGAFNVTDYGLFVDELRKVVDPLMLAYQKRDTLVRELHERDKTLRRASICLLYANSEENQLAEDATDSSAAFSKLLRESGAKVQSLNLAKLPTDTDQDELIEKVSKALGNFDAVVYRSQQVDPLGATLVARLPLTVDLDTADDSAAHIEAVYTGMVPLVYQTQNQLLTSLQYSIGLAFCIIAVVLMVVYRNPLAGLWSMIPNLFPIVAIFGSMGWLDIKVNIGMMMTASVALGVAVDDTVHFLSWFRRGSQQGMDCKQATMLAYDRCATAMFQTTVVGGLGLSVFIASTFTPTQEFGYLMITLLSAALVGDLIILPAMLAGPAGRFFGGNREATIPVDLPEETVAEQPARTATEQLGPASHIRRDSPHGSTVKN